MCRAREADPEIGHVPYPRRETFTRPNAGSTDVATRQAEQGCTGNDDEEGHIVVELIQTGTTSHMRPTKRYQFLFAVAMFGGNETYFRNLQDAIGTMEDVEPTWLPIEVEIPNLIAKLPPLSLNWTLRGALITKLRIQALEKKGKKFDAALFHHQVLTMMLGNFSERVPYIISTGVTPLQHDAYGYWYAKKKIPFEKLLHTVKQIPIRRSYQKARYVLPFSEWTKRSIVQDYKVDADKVITVPPGVNLEFWMRPRDKNTGMHAPQILFVGGEFRRKGGDILAAIALKEEFSHCHFHFVTHSYTGPAAPNIFVHTQIAPNSDYLRALYAQADIFALPTRADFSSWAIVEAMSQRLPVIATNSGGITELIRDGITGYIVPVDDSPALEERLRQLLASPATRERFGDAARAIVEENFDQRKNVNRLIAYMKGIADKTAPAAHV
jgi:glycosyltransferase involved in cell wall biosynthesis